jgi:hypothetical protein
MGGNLFSLKENIPFGGGEPPCDQVEKSGLPRPVRSDDGIQLSSTQMKIDAIHGEQSLETFGQESGFQ